MINQLGNRSISKLSKAKLRKNNERGKEKSPIRHVARTNKVEITKLIWAEISDTNSFSRAKI